jgi:uroporphyrinogen-III decarboxylase
MVEEPELLGDFIKRVGDFVTGLTEYQIEESKGRLSGMYVWGDLAYVTGMLFSPVFWREHFKPITAKIVDICHKAGLMVIYHGCGKAYPVFGDMAEIGVDGYNPLECKAGLDAVELKKEFCGRLAFVGNYDVREIESGNRDRIKRQALYKLQCAAGGGWICQSDHSVTSDVAPDSYAYMVETIRDYGRFPLDTARIKREIEGLDNKLGKR